MLDTQQNENEAACGGSALTAVLGVGSSRLHPHENKFHAGNGEDGKHYWDGLTCEWGQRNYVNPPFGSIVHQGKKKGPTAWMRKAIEEQRKGKLSVVVYPVDKWVLMMMAAIGAQNIRNLGDVKWCATEDGSAGKGTGRHIACFVLTPNAEVSRGALAPAKTNDA
jgi:hypothetical protein